MITIVDLEIGNIGSLERALRHLGIDFKTTNLKEDLSTATKLILPGVGSFPKAVRNLKASGLTEVLKRKVLVERTPILGVCLGMQLFAKKGYEFEESDGLGFVSANVLPLRAQEFGLKVPHMGWNDLDQYSLKLTQGIKKESCFYFVHGYEVIFEDSADVLVAYAEYGSKIVAAFESRNIYGTQFHPEKSSNAGLTLLRNFACNIC